MEPRIPKNTPTDDIFEQEFGKISIRVRKAFEALIPDDWNKAAMVVRETPPDSDELLEIEEPIWNPSTVDILEHGDDTELMQALEDLYLVFFPGHRPWEACELVMEPSPSGNRWFRTRFRRSTGDDHSADKGL